MRGGRTTGLVAGLLLAGVALRIALQFPLHRYPPEADSTIIAFGAWEILAGDLRIFVSTGYRQGALPCYLMAAASWFVGPGRAALALAVLAVGLSQLFVWWAALLELTGWKARDAASARLLAFVVVPSPAMLFWGIAWPNGYPDLILAATLVLWTGARFWRRGGHRELFAFSLACGFAFWMSMVTLSMTVPVLLWLVWQRHRALLAWRAVAVSMIGAVLGALPWLVFNLRYGWVSMKANWAVRPVNGWTAFTHNFWRFFDEVVPTLFESITQEGPFAPRTFARLSGWIALTLAVGAVGALLAALYRRRGKQASAADPMADLPSLCGLAAGVAVTTALLFMFAGAAAVPGNIVRYILPSFLVWPLVVVVAWEVAGRAARCALATLAVALLATYVVAVPWPWTEKRVAERIELDVERQMVARLEASGIDTVFGSFWEVYPLIFEGGGRLAGSTLEAECDFHHFEERLPTGPCRWGLVARPPMAAALREASGMSGPLMKFADGRWLFVPDFAADAEATAATCTEVLTRLRAGARS